MRLIAIHHFTNTMVKDWERKRFMATHPRSFLFIRTFLFVRNNIRFTDGKTVSKNRSPVLYVLIDETTSTMRWCLIVKSFVQWVHRLLVELYTSIVDSPHIKRHESPGALNVKIRKQNLWWVSDFSSDLVGMLRWIGLRITTIKGRCYCWNICKCKSDLALFVPRQRAVNPWYP